MNKQYRKRQKQTIRLFLFFLAMLLAVSGQAKQSSSESFEIPFQKLAVSHQLIQMDLLHTDGSIDPSLLEPKCNTALSTSAKNNEGQALMAMNIAMTHDHQQQAPIYNCPMHPKEISDKPGRCSICGMFLEPQVAPAVDADSKAPMMEIIPSQGQEAMGHDHEQQHSGTIYSCPMHPEEVSDKPGSCSICGMFLAPQASSEVETHPNAAMKEMAPNRGQHTMAHDHEHARTIYSCPMHPEEASDKPGRCSICGMFLEETKKEAPDTEMSSKIMQEEGHTTPVQAMMETAEEHTRKHQDPTYVCPMHPQIISEVPSSCPICGMDLVAKQFESHDSAFPTVYLSPAVVQNMGVRSAKVEKGVLRKIIRTQGRVTYDDDRIIQVHPRTSGWIENLYIRTDGVRIERKDDLADYFSPDVLWAQQDYISALEDSEMDSFGRSDAPDPGRVFQERSSIDLLKYFKVPSMDIMGLETSMEPRSIIPIKAPQGGILIEHNVREGTFVTPADNIFTIVDLSEVWVMVDIFEHQLAWIRTGLPAKISTPAYPGRSWNSKVDFVYPEVDPKSRTMRARLEIRNPDELLMPNMFVQVNLSANTQKQHVLMVPREAVIITGEREVVVKALGNGRFQPVEVTSGLWNDGYAEILSGLEEGEEVVVSGQFLIDSESSLQASFRRLSE